MRNKLLKALLLVLVICLSGLSLIAVGCDGCGGKDKLYYLYENEEYEQNDYINLLGGNSFASTSYGSGTYISSESSLTLMDIEGKFIVSGTISNDTINLSDGKVYRIKGDTDDQGNKWGNEAELKGFAGVPIDQENRTVSCDLPKGSTSFDFNNNVSVSLTATWKLYRNNEMIKSKAVDDLSDGDNVFKITIKSGDWSIQAVSYTVTIHVIHEVTIEYYSQGSLYDTEIVDTHTILGKGPSITNITGYTFGGWGSEGWYVTGSRKCIAVWNGVTYYVAYDGNGADNGTMFNSTHVYGTGSKLNKNNYSRTGYYFAGWSDSAEGDFMYVDEETVKTLCSTENGTITLFAFWSSAKYTVRYNKNASGATGTMSNTSLSYGVPKELSAVQYEYTGYHFVGWATEPDGSAVYTDGQTVLNLSSVDGSIVDLYAVWDINTYTMKFDGNGATDGVVYDQTYTYGQSHIAPVSSYARTGYINQHGWAITADGVVTYAEGVTIPDLTLEHDAVITVYAVWMPITYTVRYNANGGSGNMADTVLHYGEIKALTLNAFTNTGMQFAGWTLSPSSMVMSYEDQQEVTNLATTDGAVINLYAMWAANTYYVAYSKNSPQATGTMEKSTFHYGINQSLRPNAFERTGYIFMGWAATAEGDVVYADEEVVSNLCAIEEGTITIFAKWQPIEYTVKYNRNGAPGEAMGDTHFYYDEVKALTFNSYSKTGYHFVGWAIEEEGEMAYTNGQEVGNLTTTNGDEIELFALWQANTYTVTYNGNGATGGSTHSTAHVYDTYGALATNGFVKEGYRFSKWKASNNTTYNENEWVMNMTSTNNATIELSAVWIKNVTTITVTNSSSIVAPKTDFKIKYAFGATEVAINDVEFIIVEAPEGTTVSQSGMLYVPAMNGAEVKVKLILTEPYGTIESAIYTYQVAKGIEDISSLINISNDLSGDYAIVGDITIDASSWTPIGTELNPFTGTITSGNHIITIYFTTTEVTIFGACSVDAIVDIAIRYKKNA